MKKIVAYVLFSVVVAGAISAFTTFCVSDTINNTLYTVAGVIFSVGMSLTISPKTEKVTNPEWRKKIRASYLNIRNSFLLLFIISTLVYIIPEAVQSKNLSSLFKNLCALFLLISICYYTYNFVRLQRLGEDIEDKILKEKKCSPPVQHD